MRRSDVGCSSCKANWIFLQFIERSNINELCSVNKVLTLLCTHDNAERFTATPLVGLRVYLKIGDVEEPDKIVIGCI